MCRPFLIKREILRCCLGESRVYFLGRIFPVSVTYRESGSSSKMVSSSAFFCRSAFCSGSVSVMERKIMAFARKFSRTKKGGVCALTKSRRTCLFLRLMKVVSSIKTLKNRHPDCKVVKRRGRLYVINKTNPRFKARQG